MEGTRLFKRCPGLHGTWLNLIFIVLFIFAAGSEALAHKVSVFAYVEGDTVFTESYFNDGRKCVDSMIDVFDGAGNRLLEGKTNKEGEFSFKVPIKTDIRIVLTASMGHRAEYTVPASELSESEVQQIPQGIVGTGSKEQETIPAEATQVDLEQIRSVIEDTLEKKLEPLMKLIAKSQVHRVSFTEVIGGIGYIFGIMGVALYVRTREKKR